MDTPKAKAIAQKVVAAIRPEKMKTETQPHYPGPVQMQPTMFIMFITIVIIGVKSRFVKGFVDFFFWNHRVHHLTQGGCMCGGVYWRAAHCNPC